MNAFDIRLQNNLFPDMPPSFSDSVHQALRKAGVQRKVTRAPWIAATAVTALASAAAFVLILSNAFSGRQHHELAPVDPTGTAQAALPQVSAEPQAVWNTKILSASAEGHSDADCERFGRLILAFLKETGAQEPDELWILRVRSTAGFLPSDDTGSYASCVLVLAQSRFAPTDGPDLYCVQTHADGAVLWGTVGGSAGTQRVLAQVYGHQRWMIFGTNTLGDGTSIGHITAGYLDSEAAGTAVEFSAILSTEAERAPFRTSAYADRLPEYYLVSDGSPDPDSVMTRTLLLVTSESNYAYPIADQVPVRSVIAAQSHGASHALQPTPPVTGSLTLSDISELHKRILRLYEASIDRP